jgi:hypothetical protein
MAGNQKHRLGQASGIFTILLSCLSLAVGCAPQNYAFPMPLPLVSPIFASLEQVTSDYLVNPAEADVRYLGKRLVFSNVRVEQVHSIYYLSGGAIATSMVDFFSSGIISFQLLDYRGVQQRVQVGYILNLDGICQGLIGGMVLVRDCWVGSVSGDLGIGRPPLIQY